MTSVPFLELFQTIPFSTFFILGLSLALGLVTALVQRRFVNMTKVRGVRGQMNTLRKEMWEARKKGDKKSYAKLQKKQQALMKESSHVMGQQSKVMMMTSFPFLALFWVLNLFFTQNLIDADGMTRSVAVVVAYSPIPLPYGPLDHVSMNLLKIPAEFAGKALPFWVWYFLSALAVNMPINRIFRTYG